jgi:hypothetical protein
MQHDEIETGKGTLVLSYWQEGAENIKMKYELLISLLLESYSEMEQDILETLGHCLIFVQIDVDDTKTDSCTTF